MDTLEEMTAAGLAIQEIGHGDREYWVTVPGDPRANVFLGADDGSDPDGWYVEIGGGIVGPFETADDAIVSTMAARMSAVAEENTALIEWINDAEAHVTIPGESEVWVLAPRDDGWYLNGDGPYALGQDALDAYGL